jgi:hypothetical protein
VELTLCEHYWNRVLADGGGGDGVMLHADSLEIGYLHHKYHAQDKAKISPLTGCKVWYY